AGAALAVFGHAVATGVASVSRISQAGARQAPAPRGPGRGTGRRRRGAARLDALVGARGQDGVDDAVFTGLFGRHEVVALAVALDLVERLAGVVGQLLVEALAQVQDFLGLDLDVRGLALRAARR